MAFRDNTFTINFAKICRYAKVSVKDTETHTDHSTVQHHTAQHSITEHSKARHNNPQYNTARHNAT